ncbi:prenyltransferase [Leptospira sp. 96542]|nr:prenyltransferase [Leptospira sp. 96542]
MKSWLQAARLPSLSYILIPLLLGQSLVYSQTHTIDLYSLSLVILFGISNQLYIIFGNDYADLEADKINTTFTIFSGGSRVLAEEKLKPSQIKNACILFAVLSLSFSVLLSYETKSFLHILLGVFAIFLLQFYSYPPVKLSYRGGGEFLQMIGVGFVLPIFGYYANTNEFYQFPWELIPALLLINFSSAISTSLPDAPSDKLSNKNTAVVRFGDVHAKLIILITELIVLLYIFYLNFFLWNTKQIEFYFLIFPIIFSLIGWRGKPGQNALSIFVFFSILYSLSVQIYFIIFYLGYI